DLLDTHTDDPARLLDGVDAATVAKWHAALGCEVSDQPVIRFSAQPSRIDIQHDQFIDFLLVEYPDRIDGIAEVLGIVEPDGLDEAPLFHQQTGNDSRTKHAL